MGAAGVGGVHLHSDAPARCDVRPFVDGADRPYSDLPSDLEFFRLQDPPSLHRPPQIRSGRQCQCRGGQN